MSADTERLMELMAEVGQRLGTAFGDMIPDDARRHLLNAQRELLTAMFLIYEHQMGARRPPTGRDERPPEAADDLHPEDADERPRRRPPHRVDRIELE
jgi:hypothetical protein